MSIICVLLQLYLFALLARIVLSWFPISTEGPMASVQRVLYAITEPILGPLRSVIPPVRLGAMALDLSPLIVLIVLQIVIARVC